MFYKWCPDVHSLPSITFNGPNRADRDNSTYNTMLTAVNIEALAVNNKLW